MKQKKRETLVSINMTVRDVLHELGFAIVKKVVEAKELHILQTKSTTELFGNTKQVTLRTYVQNTEDFLRRSRPSVRLFYSVSQRYIGPKYIHERIERTYDSPEIFYESKEQLVADIKEWLRNNNLSISYNG